MSNRVLKLTDESSIPRPALESDEEYGLGHKLTYSPRDSITRADLLHAAWIIHTYGALLTMPQRQVLEIRRLARKALDEETS